MLVKARRDKSLKLDAELSQMQRLSEIQEKLKQSGADPNDPQLNIISKNRTWLDRVKIPMRLEIGCRGCCRIATTYFMCLFVVMIIDVLNFLKYFVMTVESSQYSENYP